MKISKIYPLAIFFAVILSISPNSYADREAGIRALFSWAEVKYPHLFSPSSAPVKSHSPWTYVYYPSTNTYIGVDDKNFVWVQGDIFGGEVYIDTLDDMHDLMGYTETTVETPSNPDPVSDLSNPDIVYQQIKALPGITSISPVNWLVGEWSNAVQVDSVMVDVKFVFNADGSYLQNQSRYQKGIEETYSGQWDVFTVENTNWHYLILKESNGNFFHYPIERDGDDAIRLVTPRSAQMYANSQLFVRLKSGSKTSVYPGRSILGTYQWDIFENSDHYFYLLIFEAPNKLTYLTYLDSELKNKSEGTWKLTQTDLFLNLGREVKYDIEVFDYRNLKLKESDNANLSMIKTDEIVANYGADLFVGEFQNGGGPVDKVDRVSIVGLGNNQYRVYINVALANYKNLNGTLEADGLLYVKVPDKNEFVVFKPVFNGLRVIKGPKFDNFMVGYSAGTFEKKYFEKISNKPLPNLTNSIGWWRGNNNSIRFYDDVHYMIKQERIGFLDYGTYVLQQGNAQMKSICGAPKQQNFSIIDNQLFFQSDQPLNPVPGMAELGRVGWGLRYLLKKHEDDSFKNVNAPLAPHPTIPNAFVVKQGTEWYWSIASESAASRITLALKPNGFGDKSIASAQIGVYISELHLPNPDWHTKLESYVEGIKYHIEIRGDKEYVVFNQTGTYAAVVDGIIHEGTFNPTSPQRESLLFDGRANVCFKLNTDSAERTLGKD